MESGLSVVNLQESDSWTSLALINKSLSRAFVIGWLGQASRCHFRVLQGSFTGSYQDCIFSYYVLETCCGEERSWGLLQGWRKNCGTHRVKMQWGLLREMLCNKLFKYKGCYLLVYPSLWLCPEVSLVTEAISIWSSLCYLVSHIFLINCFMSSKKQWEFSYLTKSHLKSISFFMCFWESWATSSLG